MNPLQNIQKSSNMRLDRMLYAILASMLFSFCTGGEEPIPEDSRVLELTISTDQLDWRECGFNVLVNANFEYKVDIDASWVSYDDGMTSTASALYFIAQENPALAPRTVTIKFTDVNDRYYSKVVTATQAANPEPALTLSIVDKDATPQTKALFANLYKIGFEGIMFGHHDDLWYGRHWYNEPGRSDTKEVCGDFPAVFSVDFGYVMSKAPGQDGETPIRRRVILEAYERGEVIMAVCHQDNPKTGGDAWDNRECVSDILTEGSPVRTEYIKRLDRLADFVLDLKGKNGELIPIILRIYHEHTQSWSWWDNCKADEFIALWQFTVRYLRDTRGVHNLLYAVSPQMDGWYTEDQASNRIVYRWPGDDYVDFIGIDCYHGQNPNALKLYIDVLEKWAGKKMKPCGITEDGVEAFTSADYWSRQVLEPVKGRGVSMVCMWRNKYVGSNDSDTHYFSVFPGHPSEQDFIKFYNDPETFFSSDLPDMYKMPEKTLVK